MDKNVTTYRVRVKGILTPTMVGWLENITIIPREPDETELVGSFADQSALRGFLDQLWNLNITILSVENVESGPGEGHQNSVNHSRPDEDSG
jgi:hypothetical protein